MHKAVVIIAMGMALNLPSLALGQDTEADVQPSTTSEFRVHIGGAVRESGLYVVDPAWTVSGAVAMAGGPSQQGRVDRVWLFRDGKIITTLLGGTTRIADSPIQSGDQLFVAWESAVPQQGWLGQGVGTFMLLGGAAAGIAILFFN